MIEKPLLIEKNIILLESLWNWDQTPIYWFKLRLETEHHTMRANIWSCLSLIWMISMYTDYMYLDLEKRYW